MPPIDQNKFPSGVSPHSKEKITAAEKFSLREWLEATDRWTSPTRTALLLLTKLDEQSKLEAAKRFLGLPDGEFAVEMSLLSQEALNLAASAVTINEMAGVYSNETKSR